jgi:hypothetical protein
MLKGCLIAVVAGVVVVVGIVVLLGAGANEVSKSIDREQAKNSITNKQARAIALGTRRKAVVSALGKPRSTQESENEGLGHSGCIYYNVRGDQAFSQWQFCFDNGRLTGKNRL